MANNLSGISYTSNFNNLDGLSIVDADEIYINGVAVDISALVPYTGATGPLDMGSFPVQSTHTAVLPQDLVNKALLDFDIANISVLVGNNFLQKTTAFSQTVQGPVVFQSDLTVSDNRSTNLSSRLEVDANYETLITSADVTVSQHFGTITNVGSVYQATTDTASGTPILIAFPIVSGRKYRISIEILVEDPTYGWYIEILQSTDNINPITSGTIDVFLIPTGSTAYTLSDHSFVALTTGSVIIQATTDAPSTNDQAVKWKNLTVYEMGVSLENATYPSLTADRVPILNERHQLVASGINSTKLSYLDNLSSDIQTQLNARVLKAGDTMSGTLDMGAQKVTTTYVPVNGPDLINKTYGDTTYATPSALAGYALLAGANTFTGSFNQFQDGTQTTTGILSLKNNTNANADVGFELNASNQSSTSKRLGRISFLRNTSGTSDYSSKMGLDVSTDGAIYKRMLTLHPTNGVSTETNSLTIGGALTQPIGTTADFASALKVNQTVLGFTQASFLSTGMPPFVNGGTITGPTAGVYRLTAVAGTAYMSMRLSGFTPAQGGVYSYQFTGMRGSVTLVQKVIADVLTSVISTQPLSNNVTTTPGTIQGFFTIPNPVTSAVCFLFEATSINPWVEWSSFVLRRADTQVTGVLTCGDAVSVAGSVGIGTTDTAGCLLRLNSATSARETGIYVRAFQASLTLDTITGRRWNIWSTEASNAVGSGCLAMYDNTATAYRFLITPAGRVGFNTTAPDGALDVRDSTGGAVYTPSLQVLGRIDFDGSNIINFQCQASAFGRNIVYMTGRFEGGNDAWSFGSPRNAITFRTQSSLNSAYTNRWTIQNFAGSLGFLSAGGGNSPRVVFSDNGNVGINTTNPGYTLDVHGGSIRAFGNAVGGPSPVVSENASAGDAYAFMLLRNNNAGTGCYWFMNSTTRSADGGANTATLRNDAGRLRLQSSGTNGILIYETSGHVEIGHRLTVGGPATDGIINIRNPNGSYSHLGWTDNWNYLRGVRTQVDTPLVCSNDISATGKVSAGTTNTIMKMGISGSIAGEPGNGWDDSHAGLLITQDASQNGNSSGLALLHGRNNVLKSVIYSLAPNVAWRPMEIFAAQIDVYYFGTPVAITNGSGWLNISDEREKEDIHDIKTSSSLKRVLALKPKHYRRKFYDEKTPVPDEVKQQRCIGFLAQEVQQSNPHCVSGWENDKAKCDTDDGKRLGMSYNDYIVHLVGAVQEQQKQIDVLQAREAVWVEHAKAQEAKVAKLEAGIEKLAGLVAGLLSKA